MGCTCGYPLHVWFGRKRLPADKTTVHTNAVHTSDQHNATATVYPNAATLYAAQFHADANALRNTADADTLCDNATEHVHTADANALRNTANVHTADADAVCNAANVYAADANAVCNATNHIYAAGANAAYSNHDDNNDECRRSDVTWF